MSLHFYIYVWTNDMDEMQTSPEKIKKMIHFDLSKKKIEK